MLSLLLLAGSCRPKGQAGEQAGTEDANARARLEFSQHSYDFGDVVQGEKVACSFVYRNAGSADLLIQDASTSCGCTVPAYSREPLQPGKEEKLEVVFDTAGRTGKQMKTIQIRSNAENSPVTLSIQANVVLP